MGTPIKLKKEISPKRERVKHSAYYISISTHGDNVPTHYWDGKGFGTLSNAKAYRASASAKMQFNQGPPYRKFRELQARIANSETVMQLHVNSCHSLRVDHGVALCDMPHKKGKTNA
jgi:hypothetical protein